MEVIERLRALPAREQESFARLFRRMQEESGAIAVV